MHYQYLLIIFLLLKLFKSNWIIYIINKYGGLLTSSIEIEGTISIFLATISLLILVTGIKLNEMKVGDWEIDSLLVWTSREFWYWQPY